MYRDGKVVRTHDEHRFILNHGALGDMITSLPAIIVARQRIPETAMKLMVYVAPWQLDLVAHLLVPYGAFDVRPITEVPLGAKERMEAWGAGAPNSVNTALQNTHTRNRVHMVDYAFAFLTDSRPENMLERSYPTAAPLGPRPKIEGEYVVFPVGATSENKLFKAKVMAPIIHWCLEHGYRPVIVGTKTSHTQADAGGTLTPIVIREETQMISRSLFGRCLDMREQTTLLELRDILGHARAVVGVDGGTLHLAGTTDTSIVYAMGATLPKHRFIARNGDPSHKIRYVGPRDLECTGCQSNWALTRWDFRECAYGDSKCMDLLHPEDFINGLQEMGL